MNIEELIELVDIREYIGQYIDLEERKDGFWGLSPFTGEQTPSFHIDKNDGVYYDFSSHNGGNAFTFTKAFFKCNGAEAVKRLQAYLGAEGVNIESRQFLDATRVCKKYKSKKDKATNLTTYPSDVMRLYEINNEKLDVWRKEGISDESLKKFNVRYDPFSNRLVYPIRDEIGRIVNIGGRTLDPYFKEKKLRKYTYFGKWGTMNVLYGYCENYNYIKQAGEVIVFEGAKSVLLADTWGIKNAVAILTSHLNDNQFKILIKMGVKIIFALDKDVNILKDSRVQALKNYAEVYYLHDWNDLLDRKDAPVDKGYNIFMRLLNNRRRLR